MSQVARVESVRQRLGSGYLSLADGAFRAWVPFGGSVVVPRGGMDTYPQIGKPYRGNDRLLFGIIMGVVAFWLFAQTTLNIAPDMGRTLGVNASVMNIAVAITSLFSGIFIVVVGGLADRVGRLKITRIGFYLSIAGSLLVAITPQGYLAAPVILVGRALQGLSAACIMPASLALVKAFWDGPERQRAISMWSIGSWGGRAFARLSAD